MSKAALYDAPEALVRRVKELQEKAYPLTDILNDLQVSAQLSLLIHKPATRHYLSELMKIHSIDIPNATGTVTEMQLETTKEYLRKGKSVPLIAKLLKTSEQYVYKLIEKLEEKEDMLR
jgi:hypothetical protein